MKKEKPFAARLSLAILCETILVFAICIAGIGSIVISSLKTEVTNASKGALSVAAGQIEKNLNSVENSTRSLAWVADEATEKYAFHLTHEFVKSNPLVMGSSVAFPGGKFAPYSYVDGESIVDKTLEYDYSDYEWFTVAAPAWSDPYFDEGGGNRLMITYSVPTSRGRVFTADVAIDDITADLAGVNLPYGESYVFIVSATGQLLSAVKDSVAATYAPLMASGQSGIDDYKSGSSRYSICYAPLSNGWSAAIVCSYEELNAKSRLMSILLLVVALLGFLVIYLVDKWMIARLTKPLLEFTVRKERFEREAAIASGIQQQMLPKKFPKSGLVDLYATVRPAKEVGGDFYDFRVRGDYLYFAIGDVSGKGVPAALYMAITRAAFHFVSGLGLKMNEVMSRINELFCEGNDSNMFVTVFAGKYNLKTRELEYCNAGHNPILIVGPDGKPEYLKAKPNIAVGLFEGFNYELETMEIAPGSRLVLYTDGVTEAETSVLDQYGEDRLMDFASCEAPPVSSENFIGDLVESVKNFTAGAEQNDDITAMSIKL